MSQPMSMCINAAAARGDEEAYQKVIAALTINIACGHYSTMPCRCTPPCEMPTQEQQDALTARVTEHFKLHPVVSGPNCQWPTEKGNQ